MSFCRKASLNRQKLPFTFTITSHLEESDCGSFRYTSHVTTMFIYQTPTNRHSVRLCKTLFMYGTRNISITQEAFEKCWAHSPLRAAARRLFYIVIHQVSLLSHAACASMSTTTSTTTTMRDRGDRYGPMDWAQLVYCCGCVWVSVGLIVCVYVMFLCLSVSLLVGSCHSLVDARL